MVRPLWKRVWPFLKQTSYDSAIPLVGIYPKELKERIQTHIYIPMFTAALFRLAKQNSPKSTDRRMSKQSVAILKIEHYLALKKGTLTYIGTWMNLEHILLNELRQS